MTEVCEHRTVDHRQLVSRIMGSTFKPTNKLRKNEEKHKLGLSSLSSYVLNSILG